MFRVWQRGQATRGYQNTWPQALHLGSISFCSRRPSQYGLASGVIGLGSGRSISMEALLVVGGQRLDGGPETVKRWQNVHGDAGDRVQRLPGTRRGCSIETRRT